MAAEWVAAEATAVVLEVDMAGEWGAEWEEVEWADMGVEVKEDTAEVQVEVAEDTAAVWAEVAEDTAAVPAVAMEEARAADMAAAKKADTVVAAVVSDRHAPNAWQP